MASSAGRRATLCRGCKVTDIERAQHTALRAKLEHTERILAATIERAMRAEAEVEHLRAALWLAQHPGERTTTPLQPTGRP